MELLDLSKDLHFGYVYTPKEMLTTVVLNECVGPDISRRSLSSVNGKVAKMIKYRDRLRTGPFF